MSGDGFTWAKAQKCPTPRAKAVLKALGAYANEAGEAWASIKVLEIECDLLERTIQRGLAECKAAGLIADTGKHYLLGGKLIPIYRLNLEVGPANTRERLAMDRAQLGVSPVTPQAEGSDTPSGATDDTPRGVTGDTQIDPNRKPIIPEGGREARLEDFKQVWAAYPKAGIRFSDRAASWQAFEAVVAEGVDPAELVKRARRCAADPVWGKRTHGPSALQHWLSKGQHEGWADEAGGPVAAAARGGFAGPPELRAKIVAATDEGFAKSYFDPSAWDGAAKVLTPRSGMAASKLARVSGIINDFGASIGAPSGARA